MGGRETGRVQARPVVYLPAAEEKEMNTKNREFLQQETGRRLESMLRRMGQVRHLAPWLVDPDPDYAALRRTVHRLRTGAIHSLDPRIPSRVLADLIERSIAQDMLVKSIARDMHEYKEISREVEEKDELARLRSMVAGFHRLKKSPEASDPDSPTAQRVRRIHRERRNELGRPRKRGR